jgi:hypothetical protein
MGKISKESNNSPQIFIDLVSELNSFDRLNREIIAQSISSPEWTDISNPLSNPLLTFTNHWKKLHLQFSDGTQVSTEVEARTHSRYLCKLSLTFNNTVALNLQFWAKTAPTSPKTTNHSPLALYHTKVIVHKVDGFMPFQYYDAIMYLIRSVIPEKTHLLLYVRQKDSRDQLEQGANPQDIPLSKVFIRAGWHFDSYHVNQNAKDPLRKHRLRLIS